MITDRQERALLLAAENRVAEPLRLRNAVDALRTLVRPRGRRESMPCPPTTRPSPNTLQTPGRATAPATR
ncbi:hypothetical protein [Streptomyces sp. NPDC012888]|uniref:hypothetical protein n=1 Tax=Streptomyces sp. NPDC012888 TaxID=3364855 RepID=UPI00369E15B9